VKFLAITLIVHAPDPLTGREVSTSERLDEVVENALLAEDLGFDGFGVGERHERRSSRRRRRWSSATSPL
jgi:hypothetical protein